MDKLEKFNELLENWKLSKSSFDNSILNESISIEEKSKCDEDFYEAEYQLLEYVFNNFGMLPYQLDDILYEGISLEETLQNYNLKEKQ